MMNVNESVRVFAIVPPAMANKVALPFDSNRAAALFLLQKTTH